MAAAGRIPGEKTITPPKSPCQDAYLAEYEQSCETVYHGLIRLLTVSFLKDDCGKRYPHSALVTNSRFRSNHPGPFAHRVKAIRSQIPQHLATAIRPKNPCLIDVVGVGEPEVQPKVAL
jgi:hypothetical protein